MNAILWVLVALPGWTLLSIAVGLLLVRWLFPATRRERAIERTVADPTFWEHAEAQLRRQP